jgi:hypothetical protein
VGWRACMVGANCVHALAGLLISAPSVGQRALAMTSAKRKQRRLTEGQLVRAKALVGIDPTDPDTPPPPGAVLADPAELTHNNTYGRLPRFYVDRLVVCRDCGTEEVWPAERQKW